MSLNEAQQRAANKWDKENMSTIACRVRKSYGDAFKEYAANKGKTPNTLLKEYIMDCVGEMSSEAKEKTGIDIMMEKYGLERIKDEPQETGMDVLRRIAREAREARERTGSNGAATEK